MYTWRNRLHKKFKEDSNGDGIIDTIVQWTFVILIGIVLLNWIAGWIKDHAGLATAAAAAGSAGKALKPPPAPGGSGGGGAPPPPGGEKKEKEKEAATTTTSPPNTGTASPTSETTGPEIEDPYCVTTTIYGPNWTIKPPEYVPPGAFDQNRPNPNPPPIATPQLIPANSCK